MEVEVSTAHMHLASLLDDNYRDPKKFEKLLKHLKTFFIKICYVDARKTLMGLLASSKTIAKDLGKEAPECVVKYCCAITSG